VPVFRAAKTPRWEPLSLGELRPATGTAKAVLLSLLHAAVSREKTGVSERIGQLGVKGLQGAGDAKPARAGLAGRATAVDGDRNFHRVPFPNFIQGAQHERPVLDRRKVRADLTAVDHHLAVAGLQANAGHRRFSSSRGKNLIPAANGPFADRCGGRNSGRVGGRHHILETLNGGKKIVVGERKRESDQHEAFMTIGIGC